MQNGKENRAPVMRLAPSWIWRARGLLGVLPLFAAACRDAPAPAATAPSADAPAGSVTAPSSVTSSGGATAAPGDATPSSSPAPAGGILDLHVHLPSRAVVPALLERLQQHGIARAVILSSSPLRPSARTQGPFAELGPANDLVLEVAAEHPGRLIPFIALDLAAQRPEDLDALLRRGACGVKLYQGNHELHERPLDDPAHEPLWKAMAARRVPVLLHVNTVRYRAELDAVLRAHPGLNVTCAHFCGARTDLDRLESIMNAHPALLFDTSNGSASFAADGYAHFERERDRIRSLIARAPHRFLFGSDLVPTQSGPEWSTEWDFHLRANLGVLREERFEFWRKEPPSKALVPGQYRGLTLPPDVLRPILEENAKRWLGTCLAPK
ncbi:amidohydrolase family protein [Chondromyces crocatus]|uniref:Amidohydrolase-related domain-containing protein n=1 Tax=Chondromyces crocatus TaxID=52 RepID=A0A0K1ESS0_CHOCO|nr:amidohydrolase family protein [Chondromyces crocatus]AKT43658.1 uncharacterized protein CMC5_078930 [Chondromyces crocatus]